MNKDERHIMNEEARRDIAETPWPPFYIPDPDECPECGSLDTFTTYDKKIVCRENWHVNNL